MTTKKQLERKLTRITKKRFKGEPETFRLVMKATNFKKITKKQLEKALK